MNAFLALLCQLLDELVSLPILRLRVHGFLRGLNCLVVLENLAFSALRRLIRDIFPSFKTAHVPTHGARRPEHTVPIDRLRGHIGHIGATHTLIKLVHSVLQVGRVIFILFR